VVKSGDGQIPTVVKSDGGQIRRWSNPTVVKSDGGQIRRWSKAQSRGRNRKAAAKKKNIKKNINTKKTRRCSEAPGHTAVSAAEKRISAAETAVWAARTDSAGRAQTAGPSKRVAEWWSNG
jgi:hypothetical protein